MNRYLIAITLFAGAILSGDMAAHGGTYIGPGDVVPPGVGSPPTTAPPAVPGLPPTATTPVTPGQPTPPPDATTPPPPSIQAPPTQQAITQPPGDMVDLTRWEFWWEFNKSHFLNLKVKVHTASASTGESDVMEGILSGATTPSTTAPTSAQKKAIIIPQLRALMQAEQNRDIAGGGMMALAKVQLDPTVTDLYKKFLRSGDQEIAETSALAFGVLQDASAYPILIALAEDSKEGRSLTSKPNGVPARTRAFAIYGLGLLGSATADATLQSQIGDRLWKLLLSDQSSFKDLKVACVISMGVIPYQDSSVPVDRLLAYLNDGNHDTLVRAHCPSSIAKILAEVAQNDPANPQIRQSVESFAAYCTGRQVPNELVQSCVYAMGMLVNRSAEFPIAQAYDAIVKVSQNSKNRQAKKFTAISMAHLGAQTSDGPYREKAIKFLLENMRTGKSGYDAWCALGLGVMSFYALERNEAMPSVIERNVLAAFNEERNPQRRGAYAISLGLMRAETAKEDLRQAIYNNRDESFQGYACLGLGMIGAREYKDFLVEMVTSNVRKPDLLKQASIALGLMRDKEVSKQLIRLIQPDGDRKPSLAVLSAAATAIGFIGDKSSVEPLVKTMADTKMTPLARAFAAIALGAVADAYELPWNSIYSRDLNYRASVQTLTNQASGILDIL